MTLGIPRNQTGSSNISIRSAIWPCHRTQGEVKAALMARLRRISRDEACICIKRLGSIYQKAVGEAEKNFLNDVKTIKCVNTKCEMHWEQKIKSVPNK